MKTFLMRNIKLFGRTVLATVAMGGFLLLAGAPRAVADNDDCQRRVVRAEHRVHQEAERHGWNSRQAARARQGLHETRERCWSRYHKWWDEHAHRWHTDRDWDEHDHDHDGDHDRH